MVTQSGRATPHSRTGRWGTGYGEKRVLNLRRLLGQGKDRGTGSEESHLPRR